MVKTPVRYLLQSHEGTFASYDLGSNRVMLTNRASAYVFEDKAKADDAAIEFSDAIGTALMVVEDHPMRASVSVGDEVRFVEPKTEDERIERFEVLELRGERVLVAMKDSGMSIVPTFVYLANDLVST